MPARKTWLLRVTEVRQELQAMNVPVVDRAVFEKLFGLQRRRAIQLMAYFGGFQAGRMFLLDRIELIRQIEPLEASAEFAVEERRRQRLMEALEKVRRDRAAARVVIPVQAACERLAHLPDGIWLKPGSLRIDFKGAEDLLGKLYALAQCATGDFQAFRKAIEPKPSDTRENLRMHSDGLRGFLPAVPIDSGGRGHPLNWGSTLQAG